MSRNTVKLKYREDEASTSTKFSAGNLFRAHQKNKESPQTPTKSVQETSQQLPQSHSSPDRRKVTSDAIGGTSHSMISTKKHSGTGSADEPSTSKGHSSAPVADLNMLEDIQANKNVPEELKQSESAAVAIPASTTSIIVNPRQRGNPILKSIRNVPWEFGDIIPDYHLGKTACALFLSLRYHQLKPDYIHNRLRQLGRSYDLRVLLVQVDVKDPHHSIKDLAQMCVLADCTLILAFSPEEAGRYLETYKSYENKPPDLIMEKTDRNPITQFTECVTSVKKLNKTDASTLISTFKSFEEISKLKEDDLAACAGFGPQKAKRFHAVLHEPFLSAKKAKPLPGTAAEKSKAAEPSTSSTS